MWVDYIVNKYYGFEIPKNITEKDYDILEELYKNSKIYKPEYNNYIFLYDSAINIINGRLHNFTIIRLGEKLYIQIHILKL